MMYGTWDLECDGTEFFLSLDYFLPFYSLNKSKNQNFEKMKKKAWRYDHFIKVYHKWQSYDVWFLRYEVWQRKFLVILDRLLLFYPLNKLKSQNFEKLKKTLGDTILHKCNKNHDHMLNCSLDMAHNGFKCFFPFWAIFCPFTSVTAWKINI